MELALSGTPASRRAFPGFCPMRTGGQLWRAAHGSQHATLALFLRTLSGSNEESKWSGARRALVLEPLSYFTRRRRWHRKVEIPRYVSYAGRISQFDEVAEDEPAAPRHFRSNTPFF